MNNLLLYIEENLVFSPEMCYETESSKPDNCSKESTKESINMPLVLPQSTLEDTYFNGTPKFTLSEKSQNLIRTDEGSTQHQISQNNTYTSTKDYTNLFLQATPAYNETDLNPKKLMQLWTENLQLQMQITITLNILFDKVLNNSAKSENGNLTNGEKVNTSNLYTNDNILSPTSANMNIFNTCQDIPFSNANTCNENLNISLNPFQNNSIQNTVNNCTKQPIKTVRVPPGYEKYHNRFKFNEDYSVSNTNTNLTTSDNYLNSDITLKETNPFKLSLAGKLNISDSREDNYSTSVYLPSTLHENQNLISDYDSILQRFIEKDNSKIKTSTQAISENVHKDTLYNRSQCYFNNTSDNTDNIKTESNTKSLSSDYQWNVENVHDRMSGMTINDRNMQYPGEKTNEIEKHMKQYLHPFNGTNAQEHVKDNKDFDIEYQAEVQTGKKSHSNYDLNKCKFSTKMPTNNLEYNSTLINNTDFHEGYFTRAYTSQNFCTSSPLLQMNNKTECSQQLLSENVNKTVDTWFKMFENTVQLNDWNKVADLPQTSDQTTIHPKNQSYQSVENLDKEEIAKSPINDNNSIYSLYPKESQLKSIVGPASLDHVIFFQVFELPNILMHIFHYQGEGWLLTDEFIQGFTKFQSTTYAIILLDTLNISVRCKNIDVTNYPLKFINIGSTVSRTIQDVIYNKNNIHLIQLKSVIEILNKLEIVSEKDVNHALINDSVVQDIWLINNAYKNLKYQIERRE